MAGTHPDKMAPPCDLLRQSTAVQGVLGLRECCSPIVLVGRHYKSGGILAGSLVRKDERQVEYAIARALLIATLWPGNGSWRIQ
jgi:hypothetical protein